MDFISLPDVFKLQILGELHWKDLNNLKLVCKELHSIIVKNIEKLDRPKVDYLHIFYTDDEIVGATYALKNNQNILRIENLKEAVFGDDREYEDFLKDKDFTEIKILVFENTINGEMICIKDSKYNARDVIDEISIFHELRIPFNGSVLRKESLRRWGLFEENGTRSVGRKIAMDLLTGNPMLEYENVSADTNRPTFIQVANNLYELGLFNPENLCNCKRVQLTFRVVGGFTVLDEEFYREFFNKIKFNGNFVVEEDDRAFSIWSSIKCSKCGARHRNTMHCSKVLEWDHAYIEISLANSILSMDVEEDLEEVE
uniref:F-box domain-containing protein n=1 Tax=Strongyloides papillosus TaxID=174720 RepID=A0A0N5CGS0_STREA